MVSAWDVYWVMQLDTIGTAVVLMSTLGLAPVVMLGGYWIFEAQKPLRALALVILWLPLPIVATFLPSSRTAAAMILVPKLTSPEVVEPIGKEAGELYQLAKDALRRLGDEKEPRK